MDGLSIALRQIYPCLVADKVRVSTSMPDPTPIALSIGSFTRPTDDDPDELIKHRYLCRGGGMMIFGGTGLGKSSLAVQLPAQFALGRGDFGIEPARPLTSLIIQSENDDGDVAEFRDGTYAGYRYSKKEIALIEQSVWLHTEVDYRGKPFLDRVAKPLLTKHKPDLLWLDHALAYYDGNANAAQEVGKFLREGLNPLLREFRCACPILHHTPKPSEKRFDWSDRDYNYSGLGSVEWAGWARAIMSIEEVNDLVFLLRASKRGARLHWKDLATGRNTSRRFIAWSTDKIFWRTPDDAELPTPKATTANIDPENFLSILRNVHPDPMSWEKWWGETKNAIGGTEKTLRALRDRLKDRCYYDPKTKGWRLRV